MHMLQQISGAPINHEKKKIVEKKVKSSIKKGSNENDPNATSQRSKEKKNSKQNLANSGRVGLNSIKEEEELMATSSHSEERKGSDIAELIPKSQSSKPKLT